jgi:hypothetical protein
VVMPSGLVIYGTSVAGQLILAHRAV